MKSQNPLIIDYKIALAKAAKYCAYQERCEWEVLVKMREWNIDLEIQDEIIADLIQQNFLNEERYAQAFTQGKIRIKQWGKRKIIHELKGRNISEFSIKKAISAIDEEIYIENLQKLIQAKRNTIRGKNDYENKAKLMNYLASKGYETELIIENIN